MRKTFGKPVTACWIYFIATTLVSSTLQAYVNTFAKTSSKTLWNIGNALPTHSAWNMNCNNNLARKMLQILCLGVKSISILLWRCTWQLGLVSDTATQCLKCWKRLLLSRTGKRDGH